MAGVTADLYVGTGDTTSVDLEWTRAGTAYRISVFRVADYADSVIRSRRQALAQVGYTDP
ncbi:MAG: hypothetical protein QOF60_3245 [Actinomycetota bacterium]|nr:hypothetical protein [Actinomycetota bacterium]